MSATAWEFVFTMFVLKLPIVYLIGVVWYAIRAVPQPPAPAAVAVEGNSPPACPWSGRCRPLHPRRTRPRQPTRRGSRV